MEPSAYDELDQLEATHWWYEGMRRITDRLLRASVDLSQPICVLDAGCGAGGNLVHFAPLGAVYGFDFSPLAVQYAQKRHPDLARASIEAIPYPDDTFALTTSFDVLYNAGVADDARGFAEMARVTCPGGHVLVRLPAMPALKGPHDDVVHGVRRYTAKGLRSKLTDAGLSPLRITYANSLLLAPIFVSRRLGALLTRIGSRASSDVQESSPLVTSILTSVLTLEATWIGSGRNFPAGVSIFGLARKPN